MSSEQKDSVYQDLITKPQIAVKVIRDQSVIEKLYLHNVISINNYCDNIKCF